MKEENLYKRGDGSWVPMPKQQKSPEERWTMYALITMGVLVLCALGILGWGVVEMILWLRRQD